MADRLARERASKRSCHSPPRCDSFAKIATRQPKEKVQIVITKRCAVTNSPTVISTRRAFIFRSQGLDCFHRSRRRERRRRHRSAISTSTRPFASPVRPPRAPATRGDAAWKEGLEVSCECRFTCLLTAFRRIITQPAKNLTAIAQRARSAAGEFSLQAVPANAVTFASSSLRVSFPKAKRPSQCFAPLKALSFECVRAGTSGASAAGACRHRWIR